jgi:hypothetical protein
MTLAQQTVLLNRVIASLAAPHGTTKITASHLNRYDFLRAQLPVLNVSVDLGFQTTFSGLFRLRYMPKLHRPIYFGMMEANKAGVALTFGPLLAGYHRETGRWEVSFVSKLMHIIDPHQAVWDSLVSGHLGLAIPPVRNLANCIHAYTQLTAEMTALLAHPRFPAVQAAFNARFPGRAYTPMRILDASIWGI